MAVWSLINKENLEGCDRLDPEYYQPCYLAIESILQQVNAVLVSDVAVCKHRKFKPIFNNIFKYIEISEIDTVTGESKSVEILGQNAPSRAQRIVKEGDVIISTVRPNRNAVSLINREQNDFVCSTGFTVLKAKEIAPEYLFTYLKTKYSIKQLERKTTASMYPAVNENDILKSLFFKADDESQKKVKKLIIEFTKCLQESKILYFQAEQILLEELGLKDLDLKEDLFYTTTLKEVKDNNRMDPEYYMTKYNKLMEHIIDISEPIKNYIKNYSTGYPFKSDNFVSKGFPLIRIANIQKGYLDISNTAFIAEKDARAALKDIAMPGDIVISMSGSIGVSAKIPSEFIKKCYINQRILRINTKNIDNDYLCLILNSIVGSYQFSRIGTGGVQTNISYRDMKEIYIPRIKIESKIGQIIRDSLNKRESAKALLEQAKYKVEEMIEKEAGVK